MSEPTKQELLDMPLHSSCYIDSIRMDILRVPGGWIYRYWDIEKETNNCLDSGVFVPEPLKDKDNE